MSTSFDSRLSQLSAERLACIAMVRRSAGVRLSRVENRRRERLAPFATRHAAADSMGSPSKTAGVTMAGNPDATASSTLF